jgi:hypothetical protein
MGGVNAPPRWCYKEGLRASVLAVAVSILAALLAGCASSPAAPPQPPPAPAPASPEAQFRELAERAKRLVIAAIAQRPLPAELPVAPAVDDRPPLEARDPLPDVAQLDFFLFAIDFSFFPTEDEASGVRAAVVLTPQGIRIAQLRAPVHVGSKRPLPDWLSVVRPLGVMIGDALRAGRTKALLFGETERALVRNDQAFAVLTSLLPTPAQIEVAAQRVARGSTVPVGFHVFHFGWLARTAGGDMFGFQLRMDGGGNGQLRSDPVVRSERVATRGQE